jgi:hypothetical protein
MLVDNARGKVMQRGEYREYDDKVTVIDNDGAAR